MKFGEKIRELRTSRRLTQAEVAKAMGISMRSYVAYEIGGRYPKKREMYKKLADYFDVDVNYLYTEDEEFVDAAGERYGRRGKRQAEELVNDLAGMFAGGTLSEHDRDAIMLTLQKAYWDAKEENIKKYTPKKYQKTQSE